MDRRIFLRNLLGVAAATGLPSEVWPFRKIFLPPAPQIIDVKTYWRSAREVLPEFDEQGWEKIGMIYQMEMRVRKAPDDPNGLWQVQFQRPGENIETWLYNTAISPDGSVIRKVQE